MSVVVPDLGSKTVSVVAVHSQKVLPFPAVNALLDRRPVDAKTFGALKKINNQFIFFCHRAHLERWLIQGRLTEGEVSLPLNSLY